MSEESLHLQKEYLDLVGWVPKEAGWVMWYETYISIFQYYEGSNSSLLKRTPENDKSIEATLKKLITIRANPYISMLSRIKANA